MSQTPLELTEKVLEAGIWHIEDDQLHYKPEGFNGSVPDSHRFGFTEMPLELPALTVQQMHAIAAQVPVYYTMLQQLGSQLPVTGTSSQYGGLQLGKWSPPPVTMIDAMITADGEVKIAEVDVINPRGLGYLALYALLHDTADTGQALEAVQVATKAHGGELTILQGSMQNFYGPYFKLLQQALRAGGVTCDITPEQTVQADAAGQLFVDGSLWQPATLLDFPVLRKMLKKAYGPLADYLVQAYNDNSLTMLYPPQPQLSSKLLLAQASEQGIFGDNLPETVVCADQATAEKYLSTGRFCIKAAVSSGMKGLWLSGSAVAGAKFPVVAQRLISEQTILDLTYASGDHTDWQRGQFLARLSLFVAPDGKLLAADITGQPYTGSVRGVHGNPDCVLTPVKLAS